MISTEFTPWPGISLIVLAIVALLVLGDVLQRTTRLSPEVIRKLFHLCGGLAALALPWMFDRLWSVLLLGIAIMILLLLIRLVPVLRFGPGQILQAVDRNSVGEFYFILGTVTIFAITGDNVIIYSIGILVLAVADAAGALVGMFYSQHTYQIPGGSKSAEGSSAFLLTAFLCIHVPILIFTDVGRLESLLIGLNLGFLLMLSEAISARGSDNAIIPVVVVLLLELFLEMSAVELAWHSVVLITLGFIVFIYRKHTTLRVDALIAATIAGYIFWLFGGWQWLVAPVVLFTTYTALVGRPSLDSLHPFNADVLIAIVTPGVMLTVCYAALELEVLYLPYVAVWGANLAVIGALHGWLKQSDTITLQLFAVNGAKSLVILLPGILVAESLEFWSVLAVFCSVALSMAIITPLRSSLVADPTHSARWANVIFSVSVGTGLSFIIFATVWSQIK